MPQEGREAAESGTDRDALALAREETRTTFEYQVQRLEEIDNKAIEILKANLLLIGILVTAGSILVQTEFPSQTFFNVFTAFGALLLFVSTALAAVTYNASNLRGGLAASDLESAIERRSDDADEAFERRLLRSYGRWIEYNAQVTAVNDVLVTSTVLLVVAALAYVIVGVGVGAAGLSLPWSLLAFAAFTLPTAWLVRRIYHMDHLGTTGPVGHGSLPSEVGAAGSTGPVGRDATKETFSGVRISKGTGRAEAIAVLRQMVGGPTDSATDPADGPRGEE